MIRTWMLLYRLQKRVKRICLHRVKLGYSKSALTPPDYTSLSRSSFADGFTGQGDTRQRRQLVLADNLKVAGIFKNSQEFSVIETVFLGMFKQTPTQGITDSNAIKLFHDEIAARAQYSVYFGHRLLPIRNMMKGGKIDHKVKLAIGKRQGAAIALAQMQPVLIRIPPGAVADHVEIKIERPHFFRPQILTHKRDSLTKAAAYLQGATKSR